MWQFKVALSTALILFIPTNGDAFERIISLDYCADQYALRFVERSAIAGLSVDSKKPFSYLRASARGIPQIRASAEDILLAKPDAVIRSYGGDIHLLALLERLGIEVIQLGYPQSLDEIRAETIRLSQALGAPQAGMQIVTEFDARIETMKSHQNAATQLSLLYVTSRGAVAGPNTLIDDIISLAGFVNFEQTPGWRTLPLENLSRQKPDIIAAGFFDSGEQVTDRWSKARHPILTRALADTPVATIPAATTSCGAWFILDAAETMQQVSPQ